MAKNDVVATSASSNVAVFIDDSMLSGPTGFENVGASDLLIPRISVIQKLSPQLDKNDPAYIAGAEYGDIVDVGTGQVFKEMVVVPCYYAMNYLHWGARGSGKGLIANHGTDASVLKGTTQDERRRNAFPDGSYISETAQFYVLNLSANGRRSFIPMSSTGLKHARKWLTLMTSERLPRPDGSQFQAPLWYRSWVVTTVEEKNAQGSWCSFKFTPGEPILALDPSKGLLKEAMAFHKQVADGEARGELATEAEDNNASASRRGDDVPF